MVVGVLYDLSVAIVYDVVVDQRSMVDILCHVSECSW